MTDSRRAKGEGTIRLRSDGRYEGREPPEIVPPGEKPRSFYANSEREVAKKLRQARREREQGLNTRSRQTVAAYRESWVAGPLKSSVARTTHQQYAALVRKYLIPGIGKIKLKELTARYVHQIITQVAHCHLMTRYAVTARSDRWSRCHTNSRSPCSHDIGRNVRSPTAGSTVIVGQCRCYRRPSCSGSNLEHRDFRICTEDFL
jgi:hypothetical protein